jgi:hypothetical protein
MITARSNTKAHIIRLQDGDCIGFSPLRWCTPGKVGFTLYRCKGEFDVVCAARWHVQPALHAKSRKCKGINPCGILWHE